MAVILPGLTPALAQESEDPDAIVRLPGNGEVRAKAPDGKGDIVTAPAGTPNRLVPGGGLILSFDIDGNGRIDLSEIETGARAAFAAADRNKDRFLTAFEQIDWADGLPTRDDTLANPVRFDPNLDRSVSLDEFTSVIIQLASAYRKDGKRDLLLSELEARPEREERIEEPSSRRPRPPQIEG
jgi:hypothetical protein